MHLEIDLPGVTDRDKLNDIRDRVFIFTVKKDIYSWLCTLEFYFTGSVIFEKHNRVIHIYLPHEKLYTLFGLSFRENEIPSNQYRLVHGINKVNFIKRFVGFLRAYFVR